MGIFGSIMAKLGFGDDEKKEETVVAQVESAPEAVENLAETSTPEVQTGGETAVVDVVAILEGKAASNSEDLDWKASIVDLMKLLDLDSSYGHRKELAAEVGIDGYHGTEDQNIALHKAVLAKVAANGGNIPADLLA
jgi:hypothetical protein